jgi:hypothetical protein
MFNVGELRKYNNAYIHPEETYTHIYSGYKTFNENSDSVSYEISPNKSIYKTAVENKEAVYYETESFISADTYIKDFPFEKNKQKVPLLYINCKKKISTVLALSGILYFSIFF